MAGIPYKEFEDNEIRVGKILF